MTFHLNGVTIKKGIFFYGQIRPYKKIANGEHFELLSGSLGRKLEISAVCIILLFCFEVSFPNMF